LALSTLGGSRGAALEQLDQRALFGAVTSVSDSIVLRMYSELRTA